LIDISDVEESVSQSRPLRLERLKVKNDTIPSDAKIAGVIPVRIGPVGKLLLKSQNVAVVFFRLGRIGYRQDWNGAVDHDRCRWGIGISQAGAASVAEGVHEGGVHAGQPRRLVRRARNAMDTTMTHPPAAGSGTAVSRASDAPGVAVKSGLAEPAYRSYRARSAEVTSPSKLKIAIGEGAGAVHVGHDPRVVLGVDDTIERRIARERAAEACGENGVVDAARQADGDGELPPCR